VGLCNFAQTASTTAPKELTRPRSQRTSPKLGPGPPRAFSFPRGGPRRSAAFWHHRSAPSLGRTPPDRPRLGRQCRRGLLAQLGLRSAGSAVSTPRSGSAPRKRKAPPKRGQNRQEPLAWGHLDRRSSAFPARLVIALGARSHVRQDQEGQRSRQRGSRADSAEKTLLKGRSAETWQTSTSATANVSCGSVRDTKPRQRWRQLSPKAAMVSASLGTRSTAGDRVTLGNHRAILSADP
jgi:hypothetical protein